MKKCHKKCKGKEKTKEETLFNIPQNIENQEAVKILQYLKETKVYDESGKSLQVALKESINQSTFYSPETEIKLPENPKRQGLITITRENVVDAAYRLSVKEKKPKICILNFASGQLPGGGFLWGARAQEEEICRHSGLYPNILHHEIPFFEAHNKSPFFSNAMIYSPNVPWVFSVNQTPLEQFFVTDIITSPAVLVSNHWRRHDKSKMEEVPKIMHNRIKKIIEVAIDQGVETLALGAFGCGAYGNDITSVAKSFRSLLIDDEYGKYFNEIVFPIFTRDENMIQIFSSSLNVSL